MNCELLQAEVTMNVTIDDRWRNVDLFWIAQRSYRIDEGRRDVCPESTSEDRDDPECYASTDRYLIEVSAPDFKLLVKRIQDSKIHIGL